MDKVAEYQTEFIDFLAHFVPKVILAGLVLWIGFKVINKLMLGVSIALNKAGFSKEIVTFLSSIADICLKVVLFFIVAGIFGINTASFVAVLAAAGFAVGMALQGSLGNFAAGIIILLMKPFKVNDWISTESGAFGRVTDIQIFSTYLLSPGQKQLIIPNSVIIGGVVSNYSVTNAIRLELSVTMPYNEDFPKVKAIIAQVLADTDKVLNDPLPEIGIDSFESHSIIINVRPYTIPDDYWEVYYAVYENIKKAFNEANIKVAYSEGMELGDIGQ